MAWMLALDFSEPIIADIHDVIDVENLDDRRLVGLIERGAHPPDRIVRLTHDGWRLG
jgi:hypothetical protein